MNSLSPAKKRKLERRSSRISFKPETGAMLDLADYFVAAAEAPATPGLRRGRRATWGSLAARRPTMSAAPTLNARAAKNMKKSV